MWELERAEKVPFLCFAPEISGYIGVNGLITLCEIVHTSFYVLKNVGVRCKTEIFRKSLTAECSVCSFEWEKFPENVEYLGEH